MNMLMKQNKKMDDDNITITTNVMQYNEVKKRRIAIKISDETTILSYHNLIKITNSTLKI